MKSTRKILSLLLTIAMLMSLMGGLGSVASAEDTVGGKTVAVGPQVTKFHAINDCYEAAEGSYTNTSNIPTILAGKSITYKLNVEKAGNYAIYLYINAKSNENKVTVTLNGTVYDNYYPMDRGGQWAGVKYNMSEASAADKTNNVAFPFIKGENTLTITATTGNLAFRTSQTKNIMIRGIDIEVGAGDVSFVAPDFIGANIMHAHKDNQYSNGNASATVTWNDTTIKGIHFTKNAYLEYSLDVLYEGNYSISAEMQAADQVIDVTVDDSTTVASTITSKASWEAATGNETIYLTKGPHKIKLSMTTTGDKISKITLTNLDLEYGVPTEDNVSFCLVKPEVKNYVTDAKATYTEDNYDTSVVGNYLNDATKNYDDPEPVELVWPKLAGATSYTLKISEDNEFPSGETFTYTGITIPKKEVYNLYPNKTYYWKVEGDNQTSTDTKSFTTEDTIRQIYAEGGQNIRDIGGWNGLNEGMAYRGAQIDGLATTDGSYRSLTKAGLDVFKNELKIKTELDMRGYHVAHLGSVLGEDVNHVTNGLAAYMAAFYAPYEYSEALRTFADIDNYPVYFHCAGGADRTGTVAMLVEAIAGANEIDLNIDYEMTTASQYSARYRYDGTTTSMTSNKFESTMNLLKEYEGETLQEKAENYAISFLGLKRAEVSNIQSILAGNKVVFKSIADLRVGSNTITLKNYNGQGITSVTLNGAVVEHSLAGDILTVNFEETGDGAINFADGKKLKFTVVAEDAYEAFDLGERFQRIVMPDGGKELTGGTTYNFDVNIKTTANSGYTYAFYLGKSVEANGFKVVMTPQYIVGTANNQIQTTTGGTAVTFSNETTASDAYAYDYVRVGAASSLSQGLRLYTGKWTLSVTPVNDTTLEYIDLRSVWLHIDGTKQAIYPSDYEKYHVVPSVAAVNGKMGEAVQKLEGYDYVQSYEDELLDESCSYARPIVMKHNTANVLTSNYIDYALYANTSGTQKYRITIDHSYYSDTVGSTGKLELWLEGVSAGSFEQTITQSGEEQRQKDTITVAIQGGIRRLKLRQTGTEGILYGITLEKVKEETVSTYAMVDNLTRIDIRENEAFFEGDTQEFDFQVKQDGNYSFFGALTDQVALDAKIVIKDASNDYIYYDGIIPYHNKKDAYKKLGVGNTAPISLKAGTDYKLCFTPETPVTHLTFIDVINTDIAVSGKTVVPAYYYTSTTVQGSGINNQDYAKKENMPEGYTIAGDYTSDVFAAQTGFTTTNYVSPYFQKNYSYTYTLNVKKAGMYKIGVGIIVTGTTVGTKYPIGSVTVDGNEYSPSEYVGDAGTTSQLVETSVMYLAEGTHTVVLNSTQAGYLVSLAFTPQDEVNVTLDSEAEEVDLSYGFAEGASGQVIVALYNSSHKLVGLDIREAENLYGGAYSVSYTETPSIVKIMAWSDINDKLAPLRVEFEENINLN